MDINNIPDHPVVSNLRGTGFPDGIEPKEIRCPKCDEACDLFYLNADREIVGCENCIAMYDAVDVLEDECEGW